MTCARGIFFPWGYGKLDAELHVYIQSIIYVNLHILLHILLHVSLHVKLDAKAQENLYA